MKTAVCLFVHKNDKVLVVTRKSNQNEYGLIGGKVDDNESFKEALIRETFEETGLIIEEKDLIFLYKGICNNDNNSEHFLTITFYLKEPIQKEPIQKETGVIPKWVDINDLFEKSPFRDYNLKVYSSYKNIKG